jgi:anti-sigma-K factor RskA
MAAAGVVGRLARIAAERRVNKPGRIRAEVRRGRVEVSELLEREGRSEPPAEVLDEVLGCAPVGGVVGL